MLPETGSISMSQVNTELKKAETSRISLNDSDVRKLAEKESGTISMGNLRGKSNSESVTNYILFNESVFPSPSESTENQTKTLAVNIPHNIIKGTLNLQMSIGTTATYNLYFFNPATVNFDNIISHSMTGKDGESGRTETINKEISKIIKGNHNLIVNAGSHRYGGYSNPKEGYSVSVKITFTGEWEL